MTSMEKNLWSSAAHLKLKALIDEEDKAHETLMKIKSHLARRRFELEAVQLGLDETWQTFRSTQSSEWFRHQLAALAEIQNQNSLLLSDVAKMHGEETRIVTSWRDKVVSLI